MFWGCFKNVLESFGTFVFDILDVFDIFDAYIYVIGNAISKENNLLKEILRLEKKVVSGPEWLYQNILSNKKVIAVSGTHGKTTVTSMIAHTLINNNFDPNYLIAGIPKKLEKSWNISNDEVFVFNGWTFSSGPSIRPFDHPVYDIWLTRCY